jgi:uncharacterized protein YbjT (DUF2867 family)
MASQDGSVLVIGAIGQQGGAAARALLTRGRDSDWLHETGWKPPPRWRARLNARNREGGRSGTTDGVRKHG